MRKIEMFELEGFINFQFERVYFNIGKFQDNYHEDFDFRVVRDAE